MKQADILYSCNPWHEHSSLEILGVFTSPAKLRKYLNDMKKAGLIDDDDLDMLNELHQTQGRDLNYIIVNEGLNPKFKNK